MQCNNYTFFGKNSPIPLSKMKAWLFVVPRVGNQVTFYSNFLCLAGNNDTVNQKRRGNVLSAALALSSCLYSFLFLRREKDDNLLEGWGGENGQEVLKAVSLHSRSVCLRHNWLTAHNNCTLLQLTDSVKARDRRATWWSMWCIWWLTLCSTINTFTALRLSLRSH